MKLRTKILVIIVPVMLITIFIINMVFRLFFNAYLEEQEDILINTATNSISTYFDGRLENQKGNTNDWAHWDDTYKFIQDEYPDYERLNINPDTFINLGIDFMIYTDKNGSIYFKRYYDPESENFKDFTLGFFRDLENIKGELETQEDILGVYNLGGAFYLFTASDITDSLVKKEAKGKLITGKMIDSEMLESIGDMFEGRIVWVGSSGQADSLPGPVFRGSDSLEFESTIQNKTGNGIPLKFVISMPRSFYNAGMREYQTFMLFNLFFSIASAIILFSILTFYLSKPFVKLIREVRQIDMKEIKKLDEAGRKDEFLFLRSTINRMLEEIEKEQSLVRDNEEKLYATLISVGDGVISVDKDGLVQFMNPIAQRLTGWSQEEAQGAQLDGVFSLKNEYTGEKLPSPIKEVFETEEVVELSNHTVLISRDGTERPIEDTAAPIRDKQGKVIGCVLVFRDYSERKEKQKRIEYLSYHDQLTGLYNRRYFEDEIRRLDTKDNLPISLIYADVNGLKTINDAFGHQIGDLLISQAAQILTSVCREAYVLSRVGGDEFNILLVKNGSASAVKLVEAIRKKTEKHKIMGINVSLSFGWATKENEKQSIWEIVKNAEDSMYQKKILSNSSKRSALVKSILDALHLMCPPEEAHSKRVALLCEAIGEAYKLNEDDLRELKIAGELHDIGKIAINKTLLNKSEDLTVSEWEQIKGHPETGYRILSTSREYYSIAEYVLAHHESWDGTGYPKGLSGENISWKARIITVADAYDAMTSKRPYRKPIKKAEAIEEIKKNSGKQFDPDVVDTFINKVLLKDKDS